MAACENTTNENRSGYADSLLQRIRVENYTVSHPQRFEIRFLGTLVRAEGIAGIVGAITIVGVILISYFGQ